MKQILLAGVFFIFFSINLFSSEKIMKPDNKIPTKTTQTFTFNQNKFFSLNNSITNYAKSKNYKKKIRNMTILAGVGGGLLGLSQVSFYTGLGLYVAGLVTAENEGYSAWSASYSKTGNGLGIQAMTFAGLGLVVFGVILVLVSVPLLITGLAVRLYYKRKVSIFTDVDNNTQSQSIGIRIRI